VDKADQGHLVKPVAQLRNQLAYPEKKEVAVL
jgi:hypothetical protein